MCHQYLGVKQKIRVSDSEYNWKDGENHWENFMKYKEVFGDIELESRDTKRFTDVGGDLFPGSSFTYSRNGGDEFFGLGFDGLQNDDADCDSDKEETRVLEEMVQLRVVGKLFLVLQMDCGTKIKEKAKEILKMHSRVWKKSSCIFLGSSMRE
ncbi:hypothetical protein L2E82_22235 [Cichorium intybus]|uniref:Uncharacterized protein n=1 Tax=Cichorium intybus TaxID=13427 RepID=A0ACB9DXX5_CICIN|nr:hypothetical protein L2E82_22235 [Cichorium intybus]